jgi:formylglycine-generating enzyme required for sulfatase activity
VECFPANGFGLYDMVGNIWDWTCSLWGTGWERPEFGYPYDPRCEGLAAGDDVWRVVRGESWNLLRDNARCAFRFWFLPD